MKTLFVSLVFFRDKMSEKRIFLPHHIVMFFAQSDVPVLKSDLCHTF